MSSDMGVGPDDVDFTFPGGEDCTKPGPQISIPALHVQVLAPGMTNTDVLTVRDNTTPADSGLKGWHTAVSSARGT
eukprot:6641374-Alexandrium_andersonii.AAC.1